MRSLLNVDGSGCLHVLMSAGKQGRAFNGAPPTQDVVFRKKRPEQTFRLAVIATIKSAFQIHSHTAEISAQMEALHRGVYY